MESGEDQVSGTLARFLRYRVSPIRRAPRDTASPQGSTSPTLLPRCTRHKPTPERNDGPSDIAAFRTRVLEHLRQLYS